MSQPLSDGDGMMGFAGSARFQTAVWQFARKMCLCNEFLVGGSCCVCIFLVHNKL